MKREATRQRAVAKGGSLTAALCVLLASGACLRARKAVDLPSGSEPPAVVAEVCRPSPIASRRAPSAEQEAPAPAEISAREAHSLLAINPQVEPYRVQIPGICVAISSAYAATIRICVSAQGSVSSVEILKPSMLVVDEQLPVVIGRWLYHPYLYGGRPMPFCYDINYRVRTSEEMTQPTGP